MTKIEPIEDKDCCEIITPMMYGEPQEGLSVKQFNANKTTLLLVEKVNEIIEVINKKITKEQCLYCANKATHLDEFDDPKNL